MLPTRHPRQGPRPHRSSRCSGSTLLGVPNHLLSTDVDRRRAEPFARPRATLLDGRTMLVRKTEVVPFECVVRGYLAGSGWKEYRPAGTVCGVALPPGCARASSCPSRSSRRRPRQEPATTMNISFERMGEVVGARRWPTSCAQRSLDVYRRAADYAARPRHHHRRHQVRVGPTRRRRADPDRRGADARQLAVLAGRRATGRAAARRRSTSSSSATGWRRPAGTRQPAAAGAAARGLSSATSAKYRELLAAPPAMELEDVIQVERAKNEIG